VGSQAHGLVLIIIVLSLGYLIVSLVLSRTKMAIGGSGPVPALIVFIVPALNEARVLAATVQSLLAACDERGRVLVIDDGSDDGTAEVLLDLQRRNPGVVWGLSRRAPHAREGKGKALNAAYQALRALAEKQHIDPSSVVFAIVDADGRLEPDVFDHVDAYFSEPGVGALQLLVRIRNRSGLLARLQDFDFYLFSAVMQTAREKLGSVGLGGNGQFTRLSALMSLGDEPWSECLTEDLDLGIRLAVAGWENRFCGETFVSQQGLTSIPKLVRQRTRWAHGHFQCWSLIGRIYRSHLPTVTVLDLSYYLLAPALSLIASVLFTLPLGWGLVSLVRDPSGWLTPFGAVYFGVIYLFSFGPPLGLALVYWRRSRDLSLGRAILLANLLPVYNYVWYVAEWKALGRIAAGRRAWSKTTRVAERQDQTLGVLDAGSAAAGGSLRYLDVILPDGSESS
jgi:cellulose synthase/poly-beta-1,6-N-acetylglucosamine synthase-like glycosyltransferase